jgi:phosphatidylserine decarboxylase
LAPGDYHRYHCPVDFVAKSRLHIPGKLAPVKESSLRQVKIFLIQGLYEGNERVVLEGEWEQGIMFLVFVGATNVGSMKINFDPELATNVNKSHKSGYKHYSNLPASGPYHSDINGVHIKKGDEIGRFEMGRLLCRYFRIDSSNDI